MDMNIGIIRAMMKQWGMTVNFTTVPTTVNWTPPPTKYDGVLVSCIFTDTYGSLITSPMVQLSSVQFDSIDVNMSVVYTISFDTCTSPSLVLNCHGLDIKFLVLNLYATE